MSIKYKAVIFDLDGTLIDSEPLHGRAWEEVLAKGGIHLTAEQMNHTIGITSPAFARLITEEWGHTFSHADAILDKRETYERMLTEELEEIPGANQLLQQLKGQTRLALCTGSMLRSVGLAMKKMNWRNVFEIISTTDHVENSKPDPEMYKLTLKRLKLDPAEVIAFEDSPAGVAAASGAGIRVVGVATNRTVEELKSLGCHHVVTNLEDETLNELFPDYISH